MKSPAILIMVDDRGEVSVIAERGGVILEVARPGCDYFMQKAPGQPACTIHPEISAAGR